MIDWEDLKKAPLDQTPPGHILRRCESIYGGVAWPGKRPGFAVVVGTSGIQRFGSHDVYLLDEFESFDTRELVRQCGVLDYKYRPASWIGDNKNGAADIFINKMNDEFARQERQFYLTPTQILDMERRLYDYILPELKDLLKEERRQLFLRDSRVLNYLREVELNDITELELGHYPAIEAIAFAVLEMLQRGDDHLLHDPYDDGITDFLS